MPARRLRLVVPLTAASIVAASMTAAATTVPPETTTDDTVTATTEDRPIPTLPAEPLTEYPLTGLDLAEGASVENRAAMVVKIDNAPAARPQTGLNAADVVFEEIVEGDITRFAAVFQTNSLDRVGPIRSGRTQDVDLLSGLANPLFVWSGGNGGVRKAINESGFVSIPDGTENFFSRSSDRPRPHNLYANMELIWDHYLWAIYPPPPLFEYVDDADRAPGEPATFAELMMGGIGVRWDYDAATDQYGRSQQGRVHEFEDGPATADNVVILLTEYRPSSADPRSPEAQTVGTGIAYVLSDGNLQIGTWDREDKYSPITLLDADDEPMLMGPGRTWVELARVEDHETVTG